MGFVDDFARKCARRPRFHVLTTAFAFIAVGTVLVYTVDWATATVGNVTSKTLLLKEGESFIATVPEQADATKVEFGRVKGVGRFCVTGPIADDPSQFTTRWRCNRRYSPHTSSSPELIPWNLLPGSSINMEVRHAGTGEAAILLTKADAENWAYNRALVKPANLLWTQPWTANIPIYGNASLGVEGLPAGKLVHNAYVVFRNVTTYSMGDAEITTTYASVNTPATKCTTNPFALEFPYAPGRYAIVKTAPDGYHSCAANPEYQFYASVRWEKKFHWFVYAIPTLLAAVAVLVWALGVAKARALEAGSLTGEGLDVSIDSGDTAYRPMASDPEKGF